MNDVRLRRFYHAGKTLRWYEMMTGQAGPVMEGNHGEVSTNPASLDTESAVVEFLSLLPKRHKVLGITETKDIHDRPVVTVYYRVKREKT